MGVFLGVISTFAILICTVWLLVNLVKRKDKKKPLIWLGAGFMLFIVALAMTPESATSNGNEIAAGPAAVEQPEQPAETLPGDAAEAPATNQAEKPMETEAMLAPAPTETAPAEESPIITVKATVTRVVDGDTIDVKLEDGTEERIRMIGVDTPEVTSQAESFGREASNFTKSELSGKAVYLEKDVTDRDRFGRLLRYVWLAKPGEITAQEIRAKMFNAILLLGGYAQVATFPPNVKYVDYFTKHQAEARDAGAGLWGIVGDAETEVETEAMFVGSATSDKYHYPDCRWAERISAANLVEFSSVEEARDAGYVPCGVCSPP